MAKRPAKEEGDTVPLNISFAVNEDFRAYFPQLREYAERHQLAPGPAARELVKAALDGLATPAPPATAAPDPGHAAELDKVRESVRAVELAVGMAARETTRRLDGLRGELAQLLRLAFTEFQELSKDDVDELVKAVFKG